MESGQQVPDTPGELARCIVDSLALSYLTYLDELEELTGSRTEILQIVGGGANNSLLCQLTADVIGREVMAGPTESTALGNLVVQMISRITTRYRNSPTQFFILRKKPLNIVALPAMQGNLDLC